MSDENHYLSMDSRNPGLREWQKTHTVDGGKPSCDVLVLISAARCKYRE